MFGRFWSEFGPGPAVGTGRQCRPELPQMSQNQGLGASGATYGPGDPRLGRALGPHRGRKRCPRPCAPVGGVAEDFWAILDRIWSLGRPWAPAGNVDRNYAK